MEIEFSGKIWYWRGPAPYLFVTIPEDDSLAIKDIARYVTYGWGVIPVRVRIGATEWKTSLFPKDGRYLVPIRSDVQKKEQLKLDDTVTLRVTVGR